MENGIIGLAKAWAFDVHEGQAYGVHPYSYHLRQVVDKISEYTTDENTIAAGWLHDGVEDTGLTTQSIQAKISYDVAQIVHFVTDPEGYDNRKDRKAALYKQMRDYKIDPLTGDLRSKISLVKCADRFCNHEEAMKTSSRQFEMYIKEFPEFIKVFGYYLEDKQLYDNLFVQYQNMIVIQYGAIQ